MPELPAQIPLGCLIGGTTATLSGLSGTLTCCSFLAFGQVRELLCQFVDFLLSLLILLATGSLAALHLFILVLAGVEFQREKIGKILRAARSTTTAASAASAALLHLDLRVQCCRIGQVLQCGAFKVPCGFGLFLVELFRAGVICSIAFLK